MVHVINNIEIFLPELLLNIDEKSFRQYMMWQDDQKMLNKYPITKFKDALISTLPYTDSNRPEKVAKDIVKVGELEFIVVTIPQQKRMSYASVYEKFKRLVDTLEEFYNDERLRKDFRTLTPKQGKEEKELYVKNRMLLEKLEEYKSTSIEGREGIKQEVSLLKPIDLLIATPESININLERNYQAVAESNARAWQDSLNMIEEGNRRAIGYQIKGTKEYVKRFKRLVLDDSLQILGEEPKNPVALIYPFKTISFKHQIEPRENKAYEPIISSFIKEVPKVLKSNSKIGDLIMIDMMEKGEDQGLRNKGLFKEDFLTDYDPQTEEKQVYIRIAGLKKRVEDYTNKNTTRSIEQNFFTMLHRL